MAHQQRRSYYVAVLCLGLAACGRDGGVGGGADASAGLPFGARCLVSEDCASSLCVRVDSVGGVCTRTCSGWGCPGASNWGCVLPEGFATRICACVADATDEICGDGIDNDCNGAGDDCRICDGRLVADDDMRHCGACGNACRSDQECTGGACVCARAGETECGGACIDPLSDASHCGACDSACPATQRCVAGACACASATAPDHCPPDGCVDLSSAQNHCGTCDTACPASQVCTGGACACPSPGPPNYCSSTGCVDFSSSASHCGGCDAACSAGQVCRSGVCVCPRAGDQYCAGACRTVSFDIAHCGGCGMACLPGERCLRGSCLCPSGLVCGGVCVRPSDSANCGACGRTCGPTQRCSSGTCVCTTPGRSPCGSDCWYLQSDRANCGSCGNVCPGTQICILGTCRCAAGQTWCAAAGACLDLSTDAANCGACGTACPGATICSGGTCRCPTFGESYCVSVDACVNFATDSSHCGSCDAACPPPTTCSSRRCGCPVAGETYCAGLAACTNLRTDSANCRTCGNACPPASTCSGSTCVCDDLTRTMCGTACADTMADPAHCGGCGRACTAAQQCIGGSCLCPGAVLGAALRVSPSAAISRSPHVAWNGTHAAVVWVDDVSAAQHIFMTLLNSDGTRAVPVDIQVDVPGAYATPAPRAPQVIWTGTEWGVAYRERTSGGTDVTLRRFDAMAVPLGPPVDVAVAAGYPAAARQPIWLRLAWSPSGTYVAAFASMDRVYFHNLGPTGAGVGAVALVWSGLGAGIAYLSLAVDPSGRHGIVFGEDWSSLQFARVNLAGAPLVPEARIRGAVGGAHLLYDGTTWVTAYLDPTDDPAVLVARGPSLAAVTTVLPSVFLAWNLNPGIVRQGSAAVVFWEIDREIKVVRLQLPASATAPVTTLGSPQIFSDMATVRDTVATYTTPNRLLMVWTDTRGGTSQIYARAGDYVACP